MISPIMELQSFKIISLFAMSPGSRFLRKEIQEMTKLTNLSLDRALRRLLNSNIIKKEKRLYSLNFSNPDSEMFVEIAKKEYIKLKKIPFNVYIILLEISSSLADSDVDLFLFGSYSKLVYKKNSDLDIAIISDEKPSIDKLVDRLTKRHGIMIEIHKFSRDFYKNKDDPLVKDITKNGVRLV